MPQAKTRPDSPVPSLQGPCDRSLKSEVPCGSCLNWRCGPLPMHQAQWSPERPLPPPVSLASQRHREEPPEVTCTSRGNPGFPASTRERPRETFFNTSRRSEEHTSELQSPKDLVCRLLLEKKKKRLNYNNKDSITPLFEDTLEPPTMA